MTYYPVLVDVDLGEGNLYELMATFYNVDRANIVVYEYTSLDVEFPTLVLINCWYAPVPGDFRLFLGIDVHESVRDPGVIALATELYRRFSARPMFDSPSSPFGGNNEAWWWWMHHPMAIYHVRLDPWAEVEDPPRYVIDRQYGLEPVVLATGA